MSTITHHIRRPAPESSPDRVLVALPAQATQATQATQPAQPAAEKTADPAAELRAAVERSLEASRTAREQAERAYRLSERTRAHAAHKLEQDLHPMRLDEATRAARRADYAAAAAEASVRKADLQRAHALEDATARVCAAIAQGDSTGMGALLVAQLRNA
ncbi:hypothetical protein LG299_14080 [Microbacterium lacus]|uniref:hypothetical protein n=1 Tax=Microbacterium lacus TaxID=415217 RepID=UPI00384C6740